MSRTLREIYTSAVEYRNQFLELTEFENSSKMSVLDAFTWVCSSCIWAFENILDVFKVDIATELNSRINGTPAYYVNALLKYQSGDSLQMNEEGTAFSYPTIDEGKRIITKASYSESQEEGFYDKKLVLKVATGGPEQYKEIDKTELLAIQSYLNQIVFAGTKATVVSRKGDIIIPRLTVYYDGAISEEEVYQNIETSLNNFIATVGFDGVVYVQKIIDAIQKANHVVDVYIGDKQGIFVAQYNDDNLLIATEVDETGSPTSYERRIERSFIANSGFLKQWDGSEDGVGIQTWKESIVLKVEE